MSTTPKPRFQSHYARAVAKAIIKEIDGATERLVVAGSLRRRQFMVGDIELLYIPRTRSVRADLFSDKEIDLVDLELERMLEEGTITRRKTIHGHTTWGDWNKLAVHAATGMPIDFFKATKSNWHNYLVCRTGSALNNTRIATAAIAKGMRWHPYGCGFTDQRGNQIRVNSEQEVYSTLGLDYPEPWER